MTQLTATGHCCPLNNHRIQHFGYTGNWKCHLLLTLLVVESSFMCTAVLPSYMPALHNGNAERADMIEHYFDLSLGYSEILLFLGSLHDWFLSLWELKRIVKQHELRRQRSSLDPQVVFQATEQELLAVEVWLGIDRWPRDFHMCMVYRQTRRLLEKCSGH